MTVATKGLAGSVRGLPPLTVATLTMYGAAVVLLVLSAATWEPGKNPRELIVGLTLVAVVFFVFIAVRGPRLTVGQASAMTAVQLGTIGALTWSTDLVLGAFANGTVLPVVGVYVLWFLHPVKGRVLLLAGLTWWFVAVAHHGDPTVTWFALSLVVQTIVAAEVFARIKTRMDRLARTDFLTGTLNRGGPGCC
jgi:prepilin signal peptidase PulO-like enzyme (type II secretory pathway)